MSVYFGAWRAASCRQLSAVFVSRARYAYVDSAHYRCCCRVDDVVPTGGDQHRLLYNKGVRCESVCMFVWHAPQFLVLLFERISSLLQLRG